jgi:putative Ca2+/H+ antiporter (TMEM165/GDT1 family)
MDIVINSFLLVFAGEMGDKTQLLALLLAARFKKPWTILGGVFVATLANHALSAGAGIWASEWLSGPWFSWALAGLFFVFALWILIPDKNEEIKEVGSFGAFITAALCFFMAEIGDKTQLATVALAARYHSLILVTAGTTAGMLAANALAVFLGDRLLQKVPMKWVRAVAALLFVLFGIGILINS